MMKRNFLLLLLMMGTILLVPACARIVVASPDESGEIEIVLSDYKFEPDVIRLKAGQTVHIRLRNEGDKMHEFMAGRDVQIHDNFTEGFGEDFFAGISPEITGPGMVMGGPEGMDMGGMDMGDGEMEMGEEEMEMEDGDHEDNDHEDDDMEMGQDDDHAQEGMEMSGDDDHAGDDMDMGEGEMAMEDDDHEDDDMEMGEDDDHSEDDMPMGEEEHEEDDGHAQDGMDMGNGDHEEGGEDEHEEEGVAGTFGALQMPEMDAHAGLMVMIDPQMIAAGEVTTITFTVPQDKVGRWQMGCFQERGQHYDDGMDGVIIVEP